MSYKHAIFLFPSKLSDFSFKIRSYITITLAGELTPSFSTEALFCITDSLISDLDYRCIRFNAMSLQIQGVETALHACREITDLGEIRGKINKLYMLVKKTYL